mmetsp:Transcript_42261/g.112843  ORF Transcript_42261/g.112843 Transcript_42261/m.112843 type:complete len:130 (+) Transcript_42261:332-721(+)
MAKYMTQSEIMSTLQAQAHIQPSLTCLVWQKLGEAAAVLRHHPVLRRRFAPPPKLPEALGRKPFQSAHNACHATEEENSDTFFAYNAMVRAKDQIMAFNYLVEQQSRLMEKIGVAGPPDQLPMVHGMGL